MYGNKRKEKKNKKNVIKTYKATYLRALPAATKDTGGVLSIFFAPGRSNNPHSIFSLHSRGLWEYTAWSITAAGDYQQKWLFLCWCPSLCGCLNASNYYDCSFPTKRQRVLTVVNWVVDLGKRRHAIHKQASGCSSLGVYVFKWYLYATYFTRKYITLRKYHTLYEHKYIYYPHKYPHISRILNMFVYTFVPTRCWDLGNRYLVIYVIFS